MIDIALQRTNMVESQVRPSDVTDRRVPRAMQAVPREKFVPGSMQAVAYCDQDVVVARATDEVEGGEARVLIAPRVLAKLIQALEINPGGLVLEIGTATGYGAAVLGQIAQTVVAVEQDSALAAQATATLSALGYDTIAVVGGLLREGYAQEGPYDAILINGAVEELPESLLDQLKDGGRLATVVIEAGVGRAVVWRRTGATFAQRTLFEATAPILPGFARKPQFVF